MFDHNIPPMNEFLLGTECTNNCSFCYQRKKPTIELTIETIMETNYILRELPYSDILFVGGEIGNKEEILKLEIDWNKIRYLYLNTNLLYKDLSVIKKFLKNKPLNQIKFTTSWDAEGRFDSKSKEELFFKNLDIVKSLMPHLVVNIIMTKSACKLLKENKLDHIIKNYSYNLLPYISEDLGTESPERATLQEVYDTLSKYNKLLFAYNEFSIPQERHLYEWDGLKFKEVTSPYLDCGHNMNFTKVFNDKSCFVCRLKELINE